MKTYPERGKGWLKDLPDFRDQSRDTDYLNSSQIAKGISKSARQILQPVTGGKKSKTAAAGSLPAKADLRTWCSPIEDQGGLGSCTAHAGVALYEYFEKRAFGKYIDGSRLFLYKATRNLLGWEGDDGAFLRTTMAAMALFGIVPEKYWPYREEKFNEEPSAFLYSYAQNYQAITYYRLDCPGVSRPGLLQQIRMNLANGLPLIFGFTCYSSLELADDGKIPFPAPNESTDGGHAVMAVGYDDHMRIRNPAGRQTTTGAVLIRNSWGREWGEGGYGWLPYDYVLKGIAEDWWSMTKAEWIDTKQFGL